MLEWSNVEANTKSKKNHKKNPARNSKHSFCRVLSACCPTETCYIKVTTFMLAHCNEAVLIQREKKKEKTRNCKSKTNKKKAKKNLTTTATKNSKSHTTQFPPSSKYLLSHWNTLQSKWWHTVSTPHWGDRNANTNSRKHWITLTQFSCSHDTLRFFWSIPPWISEVQLARYSKVLLLY